MSYEIADKEILSSPLLEQMPGWMFIKNIELKYTATTLRSALLCGFKTQEAKYGKTDYELKCKAAESAAFFQEQDKKVISSGQEISFLQLNQYADNQTHVFLTKKIPLKNLHGNIVGVCGITEEISNAVAAQAIFKLVNLGKVAYGSKANSKNFQINGSDVFNQLSVKESELVFYFIRGLTSKEIGLLMNLSLQAIEYDLEVVKSKLNCNSSNDLINYCLIHDVLNVIPQTILQHFLNKNIPIKKDAIKSSKILDADKVSENPSDNRNDKSNIGIPKRQQECVNLLLTGATAKEIAQKLHLSARTIESYIDILKSKFFARNKADLIVKLCKLSEK
ncbi:MAG: LuxR C-terminal-related transcriptional regulator [Gammaproteobacteria bacterium]|nr:LuxR C-terminal-related transcriptional regulator [Gammaproteobacteria bacterium]